MPGYPYGLGRGFGLPSGLPSTRAMTLRGSSNIGGNLQPSYNQGRLNFSGPSRNAVVVRGQRQPSETGQNPPSQWYGDQARSLVIPRSEVAIPKSEVMIPRAEVAIVKPKVTIEPGMRVGAGVPPGKTISRGSQFKTLRPGGPSIAAPAAIGLAASVELTRRIIDSGKKTDKVEIPKSKFTEMVGITHGNMRRSKEIAKRNNQPTLLNSNLQNKRSNSPGQKSKNDVLNVGVGSKTTTAYEVQLRGGDIFPLDKTIGRLAAFPVTVLGKVLKVGGGMLTEE